VTKKFRVRVFMCRYTIVYLLRAVGNRVSTKQQSWENYSNIDDVELVSDAASERCQKLKNESVIRVQEKMRRTASDDALTPTSRPRTIHRRRNARENVRGSRLRRNRDVGDDRREIDRRDEGGDRRTSRRRVRGL